MESKLSTERAFFCLSPEGKPSGRRPAAALPRRTIYDKASCRVHGIVTERDLAPVTFVKRFAEPVAWAKTACRVQSVVAKRGLFSAVPVKCFVDSDTNGNKETYNVRNMDKKRRLLLFCLQSVSGNGYEATHCEYSMSDD